MNGALAAVTVVDGIGVSVVDAPGSSVDEPATEYRTLTKNADIFIVLSYDILCIY